LTSKTRHKIYVLLVLAGLSTAGLVFRSSIEAYCSSVSWLEVVSMMIFLGGVLYAVLERNVIIGLVSVMAALILPWVKEWAVTYWPWVKECLGCYWIHP